MPVTSCTVSRQPGSAGLVAHGPVADVEEARAHLDPELGTSRFPALKSARIWFHDVHALLWVAVLDLRADHAAGAREDLLGPLVAEVAHGVVLVHEGQLDRQGVEDGRRARRGRARGKRFAQLARLDQLLGEPVVVGPGARAEGTPSTCSMPRTTAAPSAALSSRATIGKRTSFSFQ